jgi:hypothetical protein
MYWCVVEDITVTVDVRTRDRDECEMTAFLLAFTMHLATMCTHIKPCTDAKHNVVP